MTILLTIFHILVCVFLVLVVLTQQGKGQDLASAFGGAGTQAAFGARGTATLLTKITAGAAATFMVTSLMLGYVQSDPGSETVVDLPAAAVPAPAAEPEEAPPEPEGEEAADPDSGTPTGEESGAPGTEPSAEPSAEPPG